MSPGTGEHPAHAREQADPEGRPICALQFCKKGSFLFLNHVPTINTMYMPDHLSDLAPTFSYLHHSPVLEHHQSRAPWRGRSNGGQDQSGRAQRQRRGDHQRHRATAGFARLRRTMTARGGVKGMSARMQTWMAAMARVLRRDGYDRG